MVAEVVVLVMLLAVVRTSFDAIKSCLAPGGEP